MSKFRIDSSGYASLLPKTAAVHLTQQWFPGNVDQGVDID
jgi:hypothetical protein